MTTGTSRMTSTPKASVSDARERRHEQLGERRDDGLALVPAVRLELLVVAVVHLDGVAHGTRRDEERHHQHQRIEREADQMDEAEAPERGDHAGDRRPQRAAPVVEVHPAQHPLDAVGDDEDAEHVTGVAVHPAVEPRLAGDVDRDVGLRRP